MEEDLNKSHSGSLNPATISSRPESTLEDNEVVHDLDEEVSADVGGEVGGDGGLDEHLATKDPDGVGNIVGADEDMIEGDVSPREDEGTDSQGTDGMGGNVSSREDEGTDIQGMGGMGDNVSSR
jgi:hypothetical protein